MLKNKLNTSRYHEAQVPRFLEPEKSFDRSILLDYSRDLNGTMGLNNQVRNT